MSAGTVPAPPGRARRPSPPGGPVPPGRPAPPRPARDAGLGESGRAGIRLVTFTALGYYGVQRWSRLTVPAPTSRLLGLLLLAVALAGGVPWLRRIGRGPAIAATVVLCLLALPVAGLPWPDFIGVRIAVSGRAIGDGLAGLPQALVPYSGPDPWVGMVITLGAAVLLLNAAIVLAFAPERMGDLRRAGAALPLIALAVVPATLIRPGQPYAQGLILFVLLGALVWGERLRRGAIAGAIALAALAGLGAALAAPGLDPHRALVDYRAWAGSLVRAQTDAFAWNQTYGPLHWPRKGHVVLEVYARTGDYWKATNLDDFNGRAWVAGTSGSGPQVARGQPSAPARGPQAPALGALDRWSQTIRVRLGALRTADVIAAGFASYPQAVDADVTPGASDGTWVSDRLLGPGSSYVVNTYSPRPSAAQLTATATIAGRRARTPSSASPALAPYRTITLPVRGTGSEPFPQLTFAPGGRPTMIALPGPIAALSAAQAIALSPYAPVYALARRLATGARTPYDVVDRVQRYLLGHYTYNENPPASADPLVTFLLHSRIGYCQQFSGAMALLLRMDGVPARVSAGFTTGTRNEPGGPFVVSDIDAHAWVEVWFPRYGWVRFDPTPASAPELGGHAGLSLDRHIAATPLSAAPTAHAVTTTATAPAIRARSARGSGALPWELLAIAVALGLAGLVVLAAGAPDGIDAQVGELERALARSGRTLPPGTTLAGLEHRFRSSPDVAGYVRSLRLARYGGAGPAVVPGARRAVRQDLRQGLGLSGRLRALWALPPRPPWPSRRRRGDRSGTPPAMPKI